ncbi:unnamed protein product [Microthlaspi erraticum]|uniref:Retrotransposon gag domain-containing protein n=1 Tax=Microthlaspi erraticum TaxID=1685480 RepID=A0A6D2HRN6_9BRAS|nr:unnamed protein product [Microthlaspi erraticum]
MAMNFMVSLRTRRLSPLRQSLLMAKKFRIQIMHPLQRTHWSNLTTDSVVSTAATTSEVWATLLSIYGKPSRGHIRQLKYQIETCMKGTKTINEYLRIIKGKADYLALLGKPVNPEDLTKHILAGLSEEYKPTPTI